MTATTLTAAITNTTTTTFRAWGSAWNAALAAVGLVQTSDTGQINWTTVTVPSAAASGGYEIWRFADSLQATAPIYLRFEYRSGSSSVPQVYLYVGTGTDGAGTLTGTANGLTGAAMTTAAVLMPILSSFSSSSQSVYVNSADGSGLMMASLNVTPATSTQWGFMFVLERTRAWDGTATGDGVMLSYSVTGTNSSDSFINTRFISFIVGHPQQMVNTSQNGFILAGYCGVANGSVPLVFTSNILSSTTLNPVPILTGLGVKAGGPSQLIMAICPGDLPANQSITMTHYGVSRTWRASGVGNRANQVGWGTYGGYQGMNGFIVRVD